MSVIVSIRIEDSIKRSIEDLGYTPGEYIKKILAQEINKEKARKTLEWLKEHRIKTKGEPSWKMIRKDRDSR